MTELTNLIKNSKYIVVLTGAGISVESGIPDFRSTSGLYLSGEFEGFKPESILSRRFFLTNKEIFFKFYKQRLHDLMTKKPNRSHYCLVKLEELSKLKCIITQNIDNLHESAGSKNVLDIHGNGSKCICISCQKRYNYDEFNKILENVTIPRCDCGGIIRPDTVLFDEWLNDNIYDNAIKESKQADLFIAIGSSLMVQPAASLINETDKNKCKVAIINNTPTIYDKRANLVINDNCGDVLEKVIEELTK